MWIEPIQLSMRAVLSIRQHLQGTNRQRPPTALDEHKVCHLYTRMPPVSAHLLHTLSHDLYSSAPVLAMHMPNRRTAEDILQGNSATLPRKKHITEQRRKSLRQPTSSDRRFVIKIKLQKATVQTNPCKYRHQIFMDTRIISPKQNQS